MGTSKDGKKALAEGVYSKGTSKEAESYMTNKEKAAARSALAARNSTPRATPKVAAKPAASSSASKSFKQAVTASMERNKSQKASNEKSHLNVPILDSINKKKAETTNKAYADLWAGDKKRQEERVASNSTKSTPAAKPQVTPAQPKHNSGISFTPVGAQHPPAKNLVATTPPNRNGYVVPGNPNPIQKKIAPASDWGTNPNPTAAATLMYAGRTPGDMLKTPERQPYEVASKPSYYPVGEMDLALPAKPAASNQIAGKPAAENPKKLTAEQAIKGLDTLHKGATDEETIKSLQRAVGVNDDGIWGPKSQEAFIKTRRALFLKTAAGASKDAKIKGLQESLGVKADGIWGTRTQAAFDKVKDIQRYHGLVADGVMGPKTIAAMKQSGVVGVTPASKTPSLGAPAQRPVDVATPEDSDYDDDAYVPGVAIRRRGGIFYR